MGSGEIAYLCVILKFSWDLWVIKHLCFCGCYLLLGVSVSGVFSLESRNEGKAENLINDAKIIADTWNSFLVSS